jgi:hypothetical protein
VLAVLSQVGRFSASHRSRARCVDGELSRRSRGIPVRCSVDFAARPRALPGIYL